MKISQNSDYRWCSECNTLHVCLFDWKNTDDACCGKQRIGVEVTE